MEFELDRDAKFGKEGLAFDDVLLVPAESAVLPNDVATATRLTPTIALEIPIVSAAMDTVTESRLAIALAREGGIGIIHRNLSIEHQVAEIDKVKRSEAGMIVEPVTLGPDDLVTDALDLMARYRVSGVPITSPDGVLVGILTNRDLRFGARAGRARARADDEREPRHRAGRDDARRGRAAPRPPQDREAADRRRGGRLKGLITVKDIQKRERYPLATKDERGRLRVGAAVGVGTDALERAAALVAAEVDVHRRRHGARPLARRRRDGAPDQVGVRRRADRGEHRDRRGGRGADRRRRGLPQGRRRARARSVRRASSPGSACRR